MNAALQHTRGALVALLAGAALAACQSMPAATETASETAQPDLTPVSDSYRLAPGDTIRVTVFEEDNISGEFAVDDEGRLSLPLVGEVEAAGKTRREVQDAITAALSDGLLVDPKVATEILSFRPYYLFGEIAAPGRYDFSKDLTVMNAIATGGGFTYRSNRRYVYIKHAGRDAETRYELTPTLMVRPGDTVRIGERIF